MSPRWPGPRAFTGVRVDNAEDCPLYTAHVLSGIRVGPSPAWMQERLRAVGLRPINNIVDVGNYVMLEYGQPLHAFDAAKIAGGRLVVRRAAEGEKITTLDGKERTLAARTLVIADAAKPLVVAGVMGGENSGIDASTTSIVLECAIFRPASVRWTSRSLGLSSDSSYRYERGVDPHTALEAAWRAIDLLAETAGGTPVAPVCVVGSATFPGSARLSSRPRLSANGSALTSRTPTCGRRSSRSSWASPARPLSPAASSGRSRSRAGATTSTGRSTSSRRS